MQVQDVDEHTEESERAIRFNLDGKGEEKAEDGEEDFVRHRTAPNLFLSTIRERAQINRHAYEDFKRDEKEFQAAVSERRKEIHNSLEDDFKEFFDEIKDIQTEVKSAEENQILEKLGLVNETDAFKGVKWSIKGIKGGEKVLLDVSRLFAVRKDIPTKLYRSEEDDDCCSLLLREFRDPIVNYEPLTEKEFHRYLRRFRAIDKKFEAYFKSEDSFDLNFEDMDLEDEISTKLIAEFIFRHPEVSSFNAEDSKGFKSRHSLVVMHALMNSTGLKSMNFKNSKAHPSVCAALAVVAKNSPLIETADLSGCRIENSGAAFWGLALFEACPVLHTLDLSDGGIGEAGASALAVGLSKHKSLQRLDLSKNKIGRVGCKRIGEALLVNPILVELVLCGNNIGSRGAARIAAFIMNPQCKLKVLDLSQNDIGPNGGRALSVGLSANKTLVDINLSGNDFGNIGGAPFGVCLEMNKSLISLNLSDCDLADIGAAGVALGLRTNTTLKNLDLSQQVIHNGGAFELAHALKDNKALISLNLSTNSIRCEGAKQIAEMLKVNSTLQELLLMDNEIENQGAAVLGSILSEKDNRTLRRLDVSGNPISVEIVRTYFEMAEKRLIAQSTVRINVVAFDTEVARGNLRGCGVLSMRSPIGGWYGYFVLITNIISQWGGFASKFLVCFTQWTTFQNTGNNLGYSILSTIFLIFPYFYVLIMFSVPEEDEASENIDSESDVAFTSSAFLANRKRHNGCLHRLKRAYRTGCNEQRFLLFLVNFTLTRIPYEIVLSLRAGVTTLVLPSIRLTEAIFSNLPNSLIQIHILLSTQNLLLITNEGLNNFAVLSLIVSVCFSVSILAFTISSLFEDRYVDSWKKVSFANEDISYFIGEIAAYIYHVAHYAQRAMTIVLIACIYGPLLVIAIYAVGVLLRIGLKFVTHSERRKTFAIISYLVGSASWDTLKASRIAHILDIIDTIFVIAPLWVPLDQVQGIIDANPLVFSSNWYYVSQIANPVILTAIIYPAWAITIILYICFIERIHEYSDRLQAVDPQVVRKLAHQPFEHHVVHSNKRRRFPFRKSIAGGSVYDASFFFSPKFSHKFQSFLNSGRKIPEEAQKSENALAVVKEEV